MARVKTILVYIHSNCAVALSVDKPDDAPAAFRRHAEEHGHNPELPGQIIILHLNLSGDGVIAQQDFADCPMRHADGTGS